MKEIDLLPEGGAETQIRAFNALVGSSLKHDDFREYYAGQSAEEFALEQLVQTAVVPTPDITRRELVEVLRRAMTASTYADTKAYHAILRANGAEKAIGWIYWPPDWDPTSETWGNGRSISEYSPSADQIVNWLSAYREVARD